MPRWTLFRVLRRPDLSDLDLVLLVITRVILRVREVGSRGEISARARAGDRLLGGTVCEIAPTGTG